jgi:EpsI family protein
MPRLVGQLSLRASLAVGFMLVAAAVTANTFKPTQRLADIKPKISLESQIPKAFGAWSEDRSVIPVLPNPEVQASLNALYSATLARTYRNDAGQRIMLSIAYGSDQSSEATQVHRPEFCYSAQGFRISGRGQASVAVGGHQVRVQRLVATLGQRFEPISYWITLDEIATLPGLDRKLAQMRYGLKGQIPDGLLFRVSSVGLSEAESFSLQEQFINDLYLHMNTTIAPRYFGS